MKKILFLMSAVMLLCTTQAFALDYDFSGTFTHDNDVVLMNFTVGADSTITIFSSSWDDGGFDPVLAIWDSAGIYVNQQDDGPGEGIATSNETDYTYGNWDSYYDIFLTAGTYTASIAQYNNYANGAVINYDANGEEVRGSLADGFRHDDDQYFTNTLGYGDGELFNGVWDEEDQRTGDWAFHILNVEEADITTNPVPEPATLMLMGFGLLGLAGVNRKKRFNKTN